MSAGRSYYEEHKEQITQYMREYRAVNGAMIARMQRVRYAENKAKYAESQRWIKAQREKLGWSQQGLGNAVGCGQSTIARLETGAWPLERFRKRDKLYEVLGVRKRCKQAQNDAYAGIKKATDRARRAKLAHGKRR